MTVKVLNILSIDNQEGFIKLELLIIGRLHVKGIYIAESGQIWVFGDSMAKAVGFSDFMAMAESDTWCDFIAARESEKHPLHGWIFRF